MTKKKLMIILPLALLIVAGGMYKMVLAKPAPGPKPKIHGDVYVLAKDFLLNLSGGHVAKLGLALVVKSGAATPVAGAHGAAPKPPDGYGTLAQEAAVRDIVTNELTDVSERDLTGRDGRDALKGRILKRIQQLTDVPVEEVLFTDVSVQ
jgi:flagellar FliL protein